jgi:hypothetical protein
MMEKSKALCATISLIAANGLDTFFTLKYIKFGPLDESNPLMDMLLGTDASLFAFLKIFISTILIILLYVNHKHTVARFSLYGLTFFYMVLLMWWFLVIFMV